MELSLYCPGLHKLHDWEGPGTKLRQSLQKMALGVGLYDPVSQGEHLNEDEFREGK